MFNLFKKLLTSNKPPSLDSMRGIEQLIRVQGAKDAGLSIREEATKGNLMCQVFLSNALITLMKDQPTEQMRKDFELFTRMAAENGDKNSQFNLALYYIRCVTGGFLDERNLALIKEAKLWHRRASSQGHQQSQMLLRELDKAFPT